MLHPCQMAFFLILILISRFLCIAKFYDRVWDIFLMYWSKWDKMLHHFVKCLFPAPFPLRRPFGKSAFPFPSFSSISSFWKLLPRPYGSRFPLFTLISSFAMSPKKGIYFQKHIPYHFCFLFWGIGQNSILWLFWEGHVSLFSLLGRILRILNFPFTWIGLSEDIYWGHLAIRQYPRFHED